jgi:4-amino-4-deoxy-L-arabinose transferase-like glycosyltransferase
VNVIDRLARHAGAVYLLLAAYFAVNVLLRLLGPASLELDEGQQLFYAQWLAVGYDSQAPLYNWLQYWVVQLLGDTMLALALLKNLMLFLSYLLFGLAAQLIIRDRALAVVATLGLITMPQVGYEAQRDLTHTVALLFASCMFFYFFVRALQRPTTLNYVLAGVAVGIGILSKYNFVLLPVASILALLPDRKLRERLFDVRVLLVVAVAAVIVAPHALWFLDHIDQATGRTVTKLTRDADGARLHQIGMGLFSLVEAVVTVSVLTVLLFAAAFGRAFFRSFRAENQWTRLIERIFLASILLLVLVIVIGGATYVRHRWISPLFFLLPIYLAAKLDASGESLAHTGKRTYGIIVLAVMVFIPALLYSRPLIRGATGEYGKQNVPYGPAVVEILASNPDRPSVILTGDHQLAGNLRLHASGIPVALPGYEAMERPFLFDATHPVLAVWRSRLKGNRVQKVPPDMLAWFDRKAMLAGGALDVRDAALPYNYGRDGDVYHFSYAWVYPPATSSAHSGLGRRLERASQKR